MVTEMVALLSPGIRGVKLEPADSLSHSWTGRLCILSAAANTSIELGMHDGSRLSYANQFGKTGCKHSLFYEYIKIGARLLAHPSRVEDCLL